MSSLDFIIELTHEYIVNQAFKLIVTDPDSVLGGLTKEVKEKVGDEPEVGLVYLTVVLLIPVFQLRCVPVI